MRKRLLAAVTAVTLLMPLLPAQALAADPFGANGFARIKRQTGDDGDYHLLQHTASGAQVLWLENDADERSFAAGFRTPPTDSKGANHVLEHALLCGSEKYPVRELMHILGSSSVAEELNAYTSDDFTCYVVRTKNEADFYNLTDVYMDAILNPLLKTEPNIFKQQGVRVEYANGKAQYNGIVFSELKLRGLDTEENSLDFVSGTMYRNLYGDGTPVLAAGGAIPEILELTYADVMRVYNTYYKPSNMLIYLAGKQDIGKTLKMLDGYLSKADKSAAPAIAFDSDPVPQDSIVQEYNITGTTKTVDIGFMAHGPSVLDLKKSEGWGALVSYLQQAMRKKYPDAPAYTVGGTSGGVYNVGVLLSEVPVSQKAAVVRDFQALLGETAKNGVPADMLTKVIGWQEDAQQFGREEVFMGFAYGNDPFAGIGRKDAIESLAGDQTYFKALAADWRDSRYQTIVISGNGGQRASTPEPNLTAAALEQVKKDTEAFNAWVSAPDSAEAIASLPALRPQDFASDPFELKQRSETTAEADWYHTVQDDPAQTSFSLYFPVAMQADELSAWCLLAEFLQDRTEQIGFAGYFGIDAGAAYAKPDALSPAFFIGAAVEDGGLQTRMDGLKKLLNAPPLSDTAALRAFLTERKMQLKTTFADPYQTEYGLKLLSGTQSERFLQGAPAGFYASSRSYQAFIEQAVQSPEKDAALLEQLRGLLSAALRRGGIIANFIGSDADFRVFQTAAKPALAALPAGDGVSACAFLPGGWPSALVVSGGAQDSNHVMLNGVFETPPDAAVLRVACAVLAAKYLLPELRDKRGAYGAGVRAGEDGVTFSCAGGVSVDDAVAVYKGAGAFLRSLTLTERELNGFLVSAVNEFDQDAAYMRENMAWLVRSGKTQADYTRERQQVLAVSLADLRDCAAVFDQLTAQNHVFAQTTKAAEAAVQFPFACRVDADSGKITPRLKTDLAASNDKTPLTRGEMAVLLADSLIDQTAPERNELARFSDVAPGGAQADALAKLSDRGLVNGYEDGAFRPDAAITRAEFCVIADALSAGGAAGGTAVFSDVYTGYWAQDVIARMSAAGMLKGYPDGTFRPNDTITRADAVRILRRLAGQAA